MILQLSQYKLLRYCGEHAEYSTCNTHLAEGCDLFTVAGCPYMEVAKEVFEIKRRSTLHSVVQRSFPLYAPADTYSALYVLIFINLFSIIILQPSVLSLMSILNS